MIKDGSKRLLALQRCQHRTQDGGHQQQQHQALIKPDAAERREYEENDHPQPEADDDPHRLRLVRQMRVWLLRHAGYSLRKIVAAERQVVSALYLRRPEWEKA